MQSVKQPRRHKISLTALQCGSSGYAQGIVDIALSCRNETYARATASACARSESGDFCGTATIRLILDESLAEGASSCGSVNVTATGGTCPSTCRGFLESASSRLGCCINTYLNTTFNPLAGIYSTYVDYRLWNLCNVPLPAADCSDGLSLNPPPDAQDCTLQELFTRVYTNACTPSVGQPLVDTLQQNSNCKRLQIAEELVDICSTNANNEYCGAVLGLDVLSSITSNEGPDPLLTSLAINCASDSSSSVCSSSCQSAVTNIKTAYGCCVNTFNDTNSGLQTVLSYSLWNSCGVDTPGFCTASTLRLSGAADLKAFVWMIALAMAIHMALRV